MSRMRHLTRPGVPELLCLCGISALLAGIGLAAAASALKLDRTEGFSSQLGLSPTSTVTVLAAIGALLALRLRGRGVRIGLAVLATSVSLAVGGVGLDADFAPPATYGQQFTTVYEPSYNLSYGEQLAASIRQGKGYRDTSGIDTYRMPGYPALVAISGAIAGVHPSDVRGVDRVTIWMQLLLTAFALGVFAFVAASRYRRWALLILLGVLALLPANLQYTQVDSVMFAAGLLATAALLPFLDRARGDGARWRDVVVLHLAFAFCYVLRTDVAIAWAAVAVIVHRRRWRPYLVWLALFVTIGAGFGAYTATHGKEFTFGTNNTGHVAFIGLWEVPQDRFAWFGKDASYDDWITKNGYTYQGPGANTFALREIARFYATYPGYVATMAVHKVFQYFNVQTADGTTPFSVAAKLRTRFKDGWAWAFLSVILLALAVGYRRYQVALLGWAVLFVLPLYFFVQEEGRFTLFETGSLAIAGIWLLSDAGFYQVALTRLRVTVPVVAVLAFVWVYHASIDNRLLGWNAFRYWTPVLDAHASTLYTSPPLRYKLSPASNPSLCVFIPYNSANNGVPLQVATCDPTASNETLQETAEHDGYVNLRLGYTDYGTCLSAPSRPGGVVVDRDCIGLDSELWRIRHSGDRYRIEAHDGGCLVVREPGGGGSQLGTAPCTREQLWTLTKAS
jgi:hypothetical protein